MDKYYKNLQIAGNSMKKMLTKQKYDLKIRQKCR